MVVTKWFSKINKKRREGFNNLKNIGGGIHSNLNKVNNTPPEVNDIQNKVNELYFNYNLKINKINTIINSYDNKIIELTNQSDNIITEIKHHKTDDLLIENFKLLIGKRKLINNLNTLVLKVTTLQNGLLILTKIRNTIKSLDIYGILSNINYINKNIDNMGNLLSTEIIGIDEFDSLPIEVMVPSIYIINDMVDPVTYKLKF